MLSFSPSRGRAPPSINDATLAMPAAMSVLQTVMGRAQFWLLPQARNSKRFPQNGKGAVRLRSSTLASTAAAARHRGSALPFSGL